MSNDYVCPNCYYYGPFDDLLHTVRYKRYSSRCPHCHSSERARFMKIVLNGMGNVSGFESMTAIHFSPVKGEDYDGMFKSCERVLGLEDGHDLTALRFPDKCFDVSIGIDILEHIRDDEKALSEIARITRRYAFFPVPVTYDEDRELEELDEDGHVRQTTAEYYKKYTAYFKSVKVVSSDKCPSIYQVMMLGENGKNYPETIPICEV